jgi:hypothetical protein
VARSRVSSRQRRGRSRHDSCAAPRRFGPACLKEGRRMLVANCTLAQGSVGRVPALPGKRPICGVSCRRRPWALTHSTRLKLDPRREDGRLVLQVPGRDGGSLTRCPSLGELAGLGSHQRRCAGRRPRPLCRDVRYLRCWKAKEGGPIYHLDGQERVRLRRTRRRGVGPRICRSASPQSPAVHFPAGAIPLQVNAAVPLSHPRVDRAAVARRGIP